MTREYQLERQIEKLIKYFGQGDEDNQLNQLIGELFKIIKS